jgi:hypothetical protein
MKLKPCPFCLSGKHLRDVARYIKAGAAWWFVECESCIMHGPMNLGSMVEARKAWNRRRKAKKP